MNRRDLISLSAALVCASMSISAAVALEPITRDEIIRLARSGMGYSYWWGHGRWASNATTYPGKCSGSCPSCTHKATAGGAQYGADCSGFAAKAWQVPNPSATEVDSHPYSTSNFRYSTLLWKQIKRSELLRGDALVYRGSSGGHIVIFESWNSAGKAVVYECASCSIGCVHRPKTIASQYVAIRRNQVDTVAPNQAPRGYLDEATCEYIAGWAQDKDTPDKPIRVDIYFDNPAGPNNTKKISVQADQNRQDLCRTIGSCAHGFKVKLPAEYQDGKRHTVYAYGIDATGGPNKLLIGSPKTIGCDQSTGCFGNEQQCGAGNACAWNGDTYCCRPAGAGTKACYSDAECKPDVCAWNGKGFYCVPPLASCP